MQKRWRMFNATDFQSLMYPCFTFCRILGIFPYKINNSIFEASKSHYILSVIIICVLSVFKLFYHKLKLDTKTANFEVTSILFNASIYQTLTICITIFTLVLSNSRMRLLQTVMEISSRLPLESYQKLSRLIHAKDIFGYFYLISSSCIYFYVTDNFDIFFIILSLHTILLEFTMDMLYINCACILKSCFQEINNNLLHIQEFIINNEPRVSMMFYHEQRNPFLIIKLKALKKQHLMISNTVQMLNIIFSLHLLATIIITFGEIVFGTYVHVVQWYNGLFINLEDQVDVLFLTYVIYYIIKIVLLVWACEIAKNQFQEIRTTIHDVLNSSRDEQIKNELQLFSLQILHCENIFSAKGLNVDATFLATMAGTITTYILIMLQFLIISHSCDGKSAINIT